MHRLPGGTTPRAPILTVPGLRAAGPAPSHSESRLSSFRSAAALRAQTLHALTRARPVTSITVVQAERRLWAGPHNHTRDRHRRVTRSPPLAQPGPPRPGPGSLNHPGRARRPAVVPRRVPGRGARAVTGHGPGNPTRSGPGRRVERSGASESVLMVP